MIKSVKKPAFLLPFARLTTRVDHDAYTDIPFQYADGFGDETSPALTAPATWGTLAIETMAQAARADIPADIDAVEENTVPSWLWQQRSRGPRRAAESDTRQIVDRVVGAAAAKAWSLHLFSSEKHARAFYDESRYALMQRHIAVAPALLRGWGAAWAYNMPETPASRPSRSSAARQTALSNADIDVAMNKTDATRAPVWKKLFALPAKQESRVDLTLTDIAGDWAAQSTPATAAIDVLPMRHNDGSINIDALKQAARILTVLLDLHDAPATVTLANVAPLLLALGLGYDSESGRALAASLAALVTAECYAASAEMAALRGPGAAFTAGSDDILRALRNRRRAVHGDSNDYEKLSVRPVALSLKNCPDLTLAAEAQQRWDDAVTRAHAFGLRAVQVTDFTPSPALAMLMQSASQGCEPMRSLTVMTEGDVGLLHSALHPAAAEALSRLGYPRGTAKETARHIAGAKSLAHAPAINAKTLRARGIDAAAFERIESYLPHVDSVRLAVTPWIVGLDYCRDVLKIPARLLDAPRFDLLAHLGIDDADIAAADRHCYGHGTARNCKLVHLRHRVLFSSGNETGIDARIRMAAAVQPFISGDTGITASLPLARGREHAAAIVMDAWKRGLKSLSVIFDPALAAPVARVSTARKIKPAPHAPARPSHSLSRRTKTAKTTLHVARKSGERRAKI